MILIGYESFNYQYTEHSEFSLFQFQENGKSGPLNGTSLRSAIKFPFGFVVFGGSSARYTKVSAPERVQESYTTVKYRKAYIKFLAVQFV